MEAMMTATRIAIGLACVQAFGAAAAAEKGKTKAQGKIVDEQGQPLGDAIVAAVMEGMEKPFQQTKTNNKGEWQIQNLAAGKWKFYVGGKQGLEEKSVDVQVGDSGTVDVPEIKLGKPVDVEAVINADIQKANEFMQTRQPGEARKLYENILAKFPQAQPAFKAQLHGAIAQSYGAENNSAPALEHLKQATELDPSNSDLMLVYGEMLGQAGQKAESEKILMSIDI